MMEAGASSASVPMITHTVRAGNWPTRPGTLSDWLKSPLVRQGVLLTTGLGVFAAVVLSSVGTLPFLNTMNTVTWYRLVLAILWALVILSVALYISDKASSTIVQGKLWTVLRQSVTWTIYDLAGTHASRHEHTTAYSLKAKNRFWIVAAWGVGTEEYHTNCGERQIYYRSNRTYYRIRLHHPYDLNEQIEYEAGAELFNAFRETREWVSVYCINSMNGSLDMTVNFPAGARVSSLELARYRLGLRKSEDISGMLSDTTNDSGVQSPSISVAITGVQPRDLYEIWWSWVPAASPTVDTADSAGV